jgi:dTMP kinase
MYHDPKGLFIVIEGDEGTGKSTVAKALAARLAEADIDHVHMREPGDFKGADSLAEEVRATLLKKGRKEIIHPVTDILLHMGYRHQNIENIIKPGVSAGKVVISERFLPSTVALNIYPHMKKQPELYDMFCGLMPMVSNGAPVPVTFILTLPEEARTARLEGRELDRYEEAPHTELVSEAYRQLSQGPDMVVVDASNPIEKIVDYLFAVITQLQEKQANEFADFDKQMEENPELIAAASGETLESAAPAMEEPAEPVEFNLEQAVEEAVNDLVVPELFNGSEEAVEAYKPWARTYILSAYNRVNDPSMFRGTNYNTMRQKVHSILHFGYQLDLLRDPTPVTQ